MQNQEWPHTPQKKNHYLASLFFLKRFKFTLPRRKNNPYNDLSDCEILRFLTLFPIKLSPHDTDQHLCLLLLEYTKHDPASKSLYVALYLERYSKITYRAYFLTPVLPLHSITLVRPSPSSPLYEITLQYFRSFYHCFSLAHNTLFVMILSLSPLVHKLHTRSLFATEFLATATLLHRLAVQSTYSG